MPRPSRPEEDLADVAAFCRRREWHWREGGETKVANWWAGRAQQFERWVREQRHGIPPDYTAIDIDMEDGWR